MSPRLTPEAPCSTHPTKVGLSSLPYFWFLETASDNTRHMISIPWIFHVATSIPAESSFHLLGILSRLQFRFSIPLSETRVLPLSSPRILLFIPRILSLYFSIAVSCTAISQCFTYFLSPTEIRPPCRYFFLRFFIHYVKRSNFHIQMFHQSTHISLVVALFTY